MPKKNKSFSPYFTEEDANQIRAAFQAAGGLEGYASISELIETATLREVKRLQRKHNNGKKWPPLEPGTLRPGQRTRAETAHRKEP